SALVDWPRFYYAKMRDGGPTRDADIAARVRKFLLLHVVTVLGTRLVATHAYSLFGAHEYRAGLDYLGWLMLGNYAFLLGNLFSAGIGYAKRTRIVLVTFLVPGVLNLGGNLLVVPAWGGRGAAVTTVGAYAIFALLSLAIGQRFHRFAGLGWIGVISALAVAASLVPL
ncbi:MAG: polysaccharide biosynthesis C-terminal domain-containing protein, partial [Polyangiaceae bacterium]|nr:polysaccharide biosynthesis C-terminal domain-containing protein [Polyangiaceae bacterium]